MNDQSSHILTKFEPFFNPTSIVIVGASRNEYTFNGVIVKNLLEAPYHGKIYIVHPQAEEVMGIRCIPSLEKLKILKEKEKTSEHYPELAIILTQRDFLHILEKIGQLGIQNVMVETDIHLEQDASKRLETLHAISLLQQKYSLQIMGPSMIGVIDFQHLFTTSIIPIRSHILAPYRKNQTSGGVSFLAQSGGLSGACGWWSAPQNLPLAKIIHIGDGIGIKESEVLEFLFEDPHTHVIILYLKEVPVAFVEIMQKYRYLKPVLYKYVGKDDPNEISFMKAGAMPVKNYIELFEFAKVLFWCPPTTNDSVGIIGPSSGAINLIIAEMRNQNIHLARLENHNRENIISKIGGSTCKLGNPVDFWPPTEFVGTQICRVYQNASKALLEDLNVGALFLALEFFTEIEFNFTIFEKIKAQYPTKPIICVLIQAEKEGRERIIQIATDLKIPVFIDEVERAVAAFRCLLNYNIARAAITMNHKM